MVSQIDGINGFTAQGGTAFDFAGSAVSAAGDINGDGHDDFLVGSFGASVSTAGQVFVLFGRDVAGTSPFPATINLGTLADPDGFVINGAVDDELAGLALASAGDVNNDGLDDIIIGGRQSNASTGEFASGAAYVIFGRAEGVAWPNPFDLGDLATGGGVDGFAMYGVNNTDYAGYSVAGGFDLNGDGISDIAVGAHGRDANGNQSGEVYVIFGRDYSTQDPYPQTCSLPSVATCGAGAGVGLEGFIIRGISAGAYVGDALAAAGDVNDDGFDDLIIGATHISDATSPGQAYVIFGKDTSVSGNFPAVFELSTLSGGGGATGFVLNGLGADDELGQSVGAAGDVNGDGVDDVIVGDPDADNNGTQAGQAYVVFGRDTGSVGNFPGQFELSSLATGGGADGFVLNGIFNSGKSDGAGKQVGSAGDFNGDGVDDLFVSDRWVTASGSPNRGEVYIVYGKDTGTVGNFDQVFELGDLAADAGSLGLVIAGQGSLDRMGDGVALAGDINGDGVSDLTIGASNTAPNGGNSGEAYVLFSPGRINTPPEVTATSPINGVEDMDIVLGPGNLVTDAESDAQTVTLAFDDSIATLHLDPVAGVSISGDGTGELVLSGALADINTALPLVELHPVPDVFNASTLFITANDGFFAHTAFPFVNFAPVNDPPVFTLSINPVEVLEDGGGQIVEAVLTDVSTGESNQSFFNLTYEEMTDNDPLFDSGPNLFDDTLGEVNVFIRPADNANGTALVDFTVRDDGGTANGGDDDATGQFTVNVIPVNDAPVFNLAGDIMVDEDPGAQNVPNFATGIDDGDPEVAQVLMFSLVPDDPTLFSVPPAISPAGELTYTPAPDAFGATLVTVTLSDDGGTTNGGVDSAVDDFTLTINPINDPPSFTAGSNVMALDVDGTVTIPNWATNISAGPDETGQLLTFNIVSNSSPFLFAAGPSVSPAGTLSFTAAELADGTAMIELELMDDGPSGGANNNTSATQQFSITIDSAPKADLRITKGNGVSYLEESGQVTWTIEVRNPDQQDVEGAVVQDVFPDTVSGVSWTCTPVNGATCTASGSGDINDTIDLPFGGRATYTVTATVTGTNGEVVTNTATITPPESPVDLDLSNNTATDSDPIELFFHSFEGDE